MTPLAARIRGPLRGRFAFGLAALLVALTPSRQLAHEIPASVVIQAMAKPEGNRLRLLVRVPLTSMRDIVFPQRGVYLDIPGSTPLLPEQINNWIVSYLTLYENDQTLPPLSIVASRIAAPSEPFSTWEAALANVNAPPLPAETEMALESALLDVLLEVPIRSDRSRFSLDPQWAHLGVRTATVLRFLPPDGGERAFHYEGNPGMVRLDPRWHQAALTFVKLGFFHILGGIDHLLFVLCLVIPFRQLMPLLAIVTSFTVAHSITLAASALGFAPDALWFPPLIESLIALSIVYMAFENIVGARLERRWLIAFVFGLVHGFGFSFLLRDSLQFAGAHLSLSLLAFNVGVELGQVLVLAVAIPVLALLFTRVVAERVGTIILSALVAHTAWHWMTERGAQLLLYDFTWPALDARFLAALLRWLMLALILVGVMWALSGVLGRLTRKARPTQETQVARAEGSA
jgi:hypothetical protein